MKVNVPFAGRIIIEPENGVEKAVLQYLLGDASEGTLRASGGDGDTLLIDVCDDHPIRNKDGEPND